MLGSVCVLKEKKIKITLQSIAHGICWCPQRSIYGAHPPEPLDDLGFGANRHTNTHQHVHKHQQGHVLQHSNIQGSEGSSPKGSWMLDSRQPVKSKKIQLGSRWGWAIGHKKQEMLQKSSKGWSPVHSHVLLNCCCAVVHEEIQKKKKQKQTQAAKKSQHS